MKAVSFVRYLFIFFLFFFCSVSFAQNDSLFYLLEDVTITRRKVTSSVSGQINNGTFLWDMSMMHELPKILGNADPMHYTQLLPGVQTCSEYDAGLHIQGCDNAHNFVSIAGVPLYNVSHMLGFFSIFNASHFPLMEFTKSPYAAASPNRLGGYLSMALPDNVPERICGEFSVGPMSSQGTFRFPVSKKSALHVSLRAAYLNLLYSRWLRMDDSQLGYGFHDYNLTYLYLPNERNTIRFNFYYGGDKVNIAEEIDNSDVGLKWGNLLASFHWKRILDESEDLEQTFYYTGYANRFQVEMPTLSFRLPSYIRTWGYKGKFTSKYWQIGADVAFHQIQPQSPELSSTYSLSTQVQPKQRTQEYSLYANYRYSWEKWFLQIGAKGNLYVTSDGDVFAAADPSAGISYAISSFGNINFSYGWQHQYLFQTGFSSMGLPTEFWFSCSRFSPPQYARNMSLSYDVNLFGGDYNLSVGVYHKNLFHQVEYNGNMFDFLRTSYSLNELLLKGNGENYGINIMLNKRTGRLTGWLSYAWGRALRRFENPLYKKRYPASHERIHELNVVGTFRFNQRWSVGATGVFASGTPFTAPKHFLLVNGILVSEFGEFNANRLKPYCRIDLSANYNFSCSKGRESGINLSLYNATYRTNNLFYRLKFYEGKYGYKPVRFLLNILPSINYYYKF